ncbi:KR domain-containing protein [Dickeya oryzae]|uniref:beta-ketoacyl synthase N-terminal-like domain-containing protein n=1 Tax=Dickeya oryzae TaxID=1240404 RepID=UPI001AED00F6|nr:beta-ketoacyl synthase N-terminal-like domain-containing protein [Dickeya oryzae]MBP2846632.1 KR domain-containing protein [Dickeya oryzae]
MTGKENRTRDLHESAWKILEAELMQSAMEHSRVVSDAAGAVLDSPLSEVKGRDYRERLLQDILGIFSVILKLPTAKIDREEKMSTYGVDSIVITEIMGRIADSLGVSLSAAIFFEARNIGELTDIIIKRFGPEVAQRYDGQPINDDHQPARYVPRKDVRQTAVVGASASSLPSGATSARQIRELMARSYRLNQKREQFHSTNDKCQQPNKTEANQFGGNYEPIAIIGMDGMFAQSSTVEELQRHLYQGQDCISEIPRERWDWRAIHGNPKDGEFTNVKYAGFIQDVDKFDPAFFGISPREAQTMDPQHRLFLESSWRLIESSGYAPSSLAGKKVGVFAGINLQDYAETVLNVQPRDIVELTAIPHMFCPNRLSYLLDVHGPSEIIDTACSSSLVAIHRAVMSIQHGDCDMAIAGGANLILSPKMHILYSKAEMICEDGRCKTFSEDANGYARGEGVGVVLLKRLKEAQADKDHILGVIIGSAENHGGAATSLMAPNPNAQAQLVRDAHMKSGVDPRSITYIECHGTGTPLGDPVEINGLKIAFNDLYQKHGLNAAVNPGKAVVKHCALGSVKSNIGHTETAAGVAGVIKVLLAMRDEYLPKSLHCQTLNPLLELEDSPFYVLQEGQTWQRPTIGHAEQPLRAGVSSFGAGGSNVHLVIEEYRQEPDEVVSLEHEPEIIVLSAKNSERLRVYAQHLMQYVTENSAHVASHFKQFAYTLQTGRDAMDARVAFVAEDVASLLRQLAVISRDPQAAASEGTIFVNCDESGRLPGIDMLDIERWWQTRQWTKIAQVWVETRSVDWLQLYAGQRHSRLALPTYPFDRKRYWVTETRHKPVLKVVAESTGGVASPTPDSAPVNHSGKVMLQPLEQKKGASPSTVHSGEPVSAVGRLNGKEADIHRDHGINGSVADTQHTSSARGINGVKATNGNGALHPEQQHGGVSLASVIDKLRVSLARALCSPESDIHVDRSFAEMGLDSIVGAEWVHEINRELGSALSATRLYDYSSIRQLAQFIVLNGGQRGATDEHAPQAHPAGAVYPHEDKTIAAEQNRATVHLSEASHSPQAIHSSKAIHTSPAIHRAADQNEQIAEIIQLLKTSLADALYITPEAIRHNQTFAELGLDSIIGAEWINEINKRLGTRLSATRLYDYPNVQVLADYIATQPHGVTLSPKPVAATSTRVSDHEDLPRDTLKSAAPVSAAIPDDDRVMSRQAEKIAIIGMSGRYPDAENLEQYWDNLVDGRNAVREVPKSRWDVDQYFDADRSKEGKIYCKWLGALSDIDSFDPLFFSISPAEAEGMDPQHRLFLQEGYKAFEDAGYSPEELSHKKCGVYMGIMSYEYAHMMLNSASPLSGTGNSFAIGAARIPYFLNLKGPAIPVDTACSSSLVTTHLAVQALQSGEIDLALVGGVSLYLMPETYIGMCSAGMLSPEGQCKAFDNTADGFVPGEGVGCLVLKRLSQAEIDGDPIYGVIIGSGINQDGKTNGITAPSVNSQRELEREVYRKHQINPDSISYIETHGTGTKLGDPIELEALESVFREWTPRKNFCGLGSVKSNIGHTSAASGMASVQKVLLSMKHRQLVPSLHFRTPNQHFGFDDSPFYVNTQCKPWQHDERQPRRAAVSSFGYSGTNAHLVIEEYLPPAVETAPEAKPVLIVLSAMRADRLPLMAENLLAWLQREQAEGRTVDLRRLAYTLQRGRRAMEERLAFVAGSVSELQEKLTQFIVGDISAPLLFRGRVNDNAPSYKAFVDTPEFSTVIEQWTRQQNLSQLAGLWVTGLDIPWDLLYSAPEQAGQSTAHRSPSRINLPTYPFFRQSCWFAEKAPPTSVTTVDVRSVLSEDAETVRTSEATETGTHAQPIVRETQWIRATETWVEVKASEDSQWVERIKASSDRQILVLSHTASDYRDIEQVCQQVQQIADMPQPIWDVRHITLPVGALQAQTGINALKVGLAAAIPDSGKPLAVFLILPHGTEVQTELAYRCVQAVQTVARLNPVQFYCCHRADYEQGLTVTDVHHEALSGLFRSAILETVGHRYRSLIVDPRSTGQEVALQLMQTWLCDDMPAHEPGKNAQAVRTPTIRFSGGRRYELRVSETDGHEVPGALFRTGATYLMVGALGETGEQVCQVLGHHYQAQLVIFSRRPEHQVAPILARIRASGAQVIYRAVDILDLERVNQAVQSLKSEGITLNGVLHMARQVSDGSILNKSWDAFRHMMAAKVSGTLNIDAVTADEPLEFFLMFSSVAAFGIQGSPDYAYSAAFQNAFARYRQRLVSLKQRQGLVSSVCWGQWEVDGAVDHTRLAGRLTSLAQQGMGSIHAVAAVQQMQTGVTDGVTALVAVTDKHKARMLLGLGDNQMASAAARTEHHIVDAVRQKISHFRQGQLSPTEFADYLSSLSLADLPAYLQQEVGTVITTIQSVPPTQTLNAPQSGLQTGRPETSGDIDEIKLADDDSELRSSLAFGIEKVMKLGSSLDWDKPLQDYGMDSIIAMQLSTTLERQLKFPVQPNWLIEHPTPNLLMKKLRKQVGTGGIRL